MIQISKNFEFINKKKIVSAYRPSVCTVKIIELERRLKRRNSDCVGKFCFCFCFYLVFVIVSLSFFSGLCCERPATPLLLRQLRCAHILAAVGSHLEKHLVVALSDCSSYCLMCYSCEEYFISFRWEEKKQKLLIVAPNRESFSC